MPLDHLERAAALLRAVLVSSCETIEVSLSRESGKVLLHFSYVLRADGVMRTTTQVIDVAESSDADRKAVIHAACTSLRTGIEWAALAVGPAQRSAG